MRALKLSPEQAEQNRAIIETAKRVLKAESESVSALIDRVDDQFAQVVHLLDQCKGQVIVTGMGKSGLIGKKIASTFSSIGLRAMFLHAAEASHGDIGMISQGDLIIAISKSGETGELLTLLPTFNRVRCTLVAMTGNLKSTLAMRSDVVLDISVREEACSLGLVPTASTTACMAMGDALALALLDKRGFREEDFAQNHPGGSLGRKMLTTVNDLMHTGEEVPRVPEDATIPDVITEMTRKYLGTTLVVDKQGFLTGIITDGDLRRLIEAGKDISKTRAREIMSPNPKSVRKDDMATKAVRVMEENSITCVVVSEDKKTIDGILHLHHLLKAGIV